MSDHALQGAPPPVPPPRRRRRRWLPRTILVLAVLLAALVGAVAWLLMTTSGARFALSRGVEAAGGSVRYENLQGSFGGPLSFGLVEIDLPGLYARVENLRVDASPWAPLRGRLLVHALEADRVEVRTAPSQEPARIPASLASPYPVRLERGSVGELRVGELTPAAAVEKDPAKKRALMEPSRAGDLVVRAIALRLEGDTGSWRIEEAKATTAWGRGALTGRIEAHRPFGLTAAFDGEGVAAGRPWSARVGARGTLAAIEAGVEGAVSGQPATGRLRVEPFVAQPLRAIELTARDVDLSKHVEGPRTRLAIEATLAADAKGLAGPARILNRDPGPWDAGRLPVASASAQVVAGAEGVELRELAVALAGGGRVSGKAAIARDGARAELRLESVDLAALHSGLRKTDMSGKASVSGDRSAQRFGVALADPRFALEGRAGLAGEKLAIETVTVRTAGGEATAKGEVSLAGPRGFRIVGRARRLDPSDFLDAPKGDLNFTFAASGTAGPSPAGEVTVELAPSAFAGLPASGRVAAAGDARRISRLDLQLGLGGARATARGAFGRPGDALDVTLDAPDLAQVARALGVALSGSARAEARLTGTREAPAGRVSLTAANLGLPADVFMRELALRIEAGAADSSPIEGSVRARGIALGQGAAGRRLAETATVSIHGTRAAHRVDFAMQVRPDAALSAALDGGLDPKADAPAWSGRLASLEMTGRGAFALTRPAALALSARRVELGEATLKGGWGEVRLDLTRWTPASLDSRGSTAGIHVRNLAREFQLATVPRSSLVVALDWDVRAGSQLDAHASLRRVSGDLRLGEPATPLGLQALEARLDVVAGQAKASLAVAGERVGRIDGEGTATIARGARGWELAPAAPVAARLVVEHTNLQALTPWLGPDSRLGGRLNGRVEVSGTGAEPHVSGGVRAQDLVLRESQSGFELERGTVALAVTGRSLEIEKLEAFAPWRLPEGAAERLRGVRLPAQGGRMTAEGSIDLAARTGSVSLKLDKMPVTRTHTRFLAVSGETRLEAGPKQMLLTGALEADAGWVGALDTPPPSVSEDVVVVRAARPAAAQEQALPHEAIRIDMRLAAGDRLYLQGRGLDTRLAGELHITGALGALRADGSIRTAGGTYDGYGQKLSIERGVLTFQGPLDNPRLNVLALRKGLPVEAGVEVLGSISRPRVRLVSVPNVPETEKLSWLVLGRGPADASVGDSALMVAAARALLGENNPGDITKQLGIDEIKIGRAESGVLGVLPQSTVAGRTGTASAAEVVTVGRRLNRQLQLTYEQGLADAEGALKLAWRITRQFQLLARAGYLPGIDAVYRWTFE